MSAEEGLLKKWKVPLGEDFTEIVNDDSVQLSNVDESRVVYLSMLSAEKSGWLADIKDDFGPPVVEEIGNFWHFKGVKVRGNEALIVVITFNRLEDLAWAERLFAEIS